MFELAKMTYKTLKRVFIFLIGSTIVLTGAVMFFTPGPGIVVMLVGLVLLATEFIWARILLKKFKDKAESLSKNTLRAFNNKSKPNQNGINDKKNSDY